MGQLNYKGFLIFLALQPEISGWLKYFHLHVQKVHTLQECIPVGCVPPAAVVVCCRGVCLSACWDTPTGLDPQGVGLGTPLCGPGYPPQSDPSTSPLGVGWTPPSQTPQPPQWVWPGDPPVNKMIDRQV